MEQRQLDALAQRLARDPQDAEALNQAYQHGQSDPRAYAMFLEKVAAASTEVTYAAHWYSEAANVWTASLNDPHRAARALMSAIDKDPSNVTASDRLSQLYREKNDLKGVAALLDRRAKNLVKASSERPELGVEAARVYAELGRLFQEELGQAEKAIVAYKRSVELDSTDAYSIYQVRELLKAAGRHRDAIPYFAAEQALIENEPERSLALYHDEAEACRIVGDASGLALALRGARKIDPEDPNLKQQLASTVLERVQARRPPPDDERAEGAQLFIELAETYGGEHGYSYSACAVECEPTNDRATQLLLYYGEQCGKGLEPAHLAAEYLRQNPKGVMAAEARALVARAVEAGEHSLLDALTPPDDADPSERVMALVEMAKALVVQSKKREAAEKFKEVVAIEPANLDAVEFLEGHLRAGRKYAELRDLLFAAAAAAPSTEEVQRVHWFNEIAGICEGQLRDVDGAIEARRQLVMLDPSDETSAAQLEKTLRKAGRYDELAALIQRQAERSEDIEQRLNHERRLADLHERKRGDLVAAGETWSRIAELTPDDESVVEKAVALFEAGERTDLAIHLLTARLPGLVDDASRAELGRKLGDLKRASGDVYGAGEAYAESATARSSIELWHAAEQCFAETQAWQQAARAAGERAGLTVEAPDQARLVALEADYLIRAGEDAVAVERFERALELDPGSDELSARLEAIFEAAGRYQDIADLLIRRADRLNAPAVRMALRKRAATIQREQLQDFGAMRDTLAALLQDGDDLESLIILADDAEQRAEHVAAAEYLGRLVAIAPEEDRMAYALREARVLDEGLDDLQGAIGKYEDIVARDPKSAVALGALANLQERIGETGAAAATLERLLAISEGDAALSAAEKLAEAYETLGEAKGAIRALEVVVSLEETDFDAIQRLADLSQSVEDWERHAKYLEMLAEVEGDEAEASRMTLHLAKVVREQLGQHDRALEVLASLAAAGDSACRDEFVRLGDELDRKGLVASKLVEWFAEAPANEERREALRGAFERYVEVGESPKAIEVGLELVRIKGATGDVPERLETLAVSEKNLDALAAAHDLLVRELSGPPRAEEMVRQAEVRHELGIPAESCVEHGELALSSMAADDVEPLLVRLSKIAGAPPQVIGVYERQVMRCKAPADRLRALARAAQVAVEVKSPERAREFFDIALSQAPKEQALDDLTDIARETDRAAKDRTLRTILAEALAAGGQGARDGGRTRSGFLGRAAALAFEDLEDVERALGWVTEALVAHVDDARLDQLEELAEATGHPQRAAAVIERALEEVFDGPLVRQLLARRASIREFKLDDPRVAAEDLKRLHDLSPGDSEVSEHLGELYTRLEDYRGMVQLHEDRILRGKDPSLRAELARKVAKLWENELDNPREAADAWRRVLRMKQGDDEAQEGLARAKATMLERKRAAAPPSGPLAAPAPLDPPTTATELQSEPREPDVSTADESGDEVDESGDEVDEASGENADEPFTEAKDASVDDDGESGAAATDDEVAAASPDAPEQPVDDSSESPAGPVSSAEKAPSELEASVAAGASSEEERFPSGDGSDGVDQLVDDSEDDFDTVALDQAAVKAAVEDVSIRDPEESKTETDLVAHEPPAEARDDAPTEVDMEMPSAVASDDNDGELIDDSLAADVDEDDLFDENSIVEVATGDEFVRETVSNEAYEDEENVTVALDPEAIQAALAQAEASAEDADERKVDSGVKKSAPPPPPSRGGALGRSVPPPPPARGPSGRSLPPPTSSKSSLPPPLPSSATSSRPPPFPGSKASVPPPPPKRSGHAPPPPAASGRRPAAPPPPAPSGRTAPPPPPSPAVKKA